MYKGRLTNLPTIKIGITELEVKTFLNFTIFEKEHILCSNESCVFKKV